MLFDWDSVNINHIARHSVKPYEAEEVVKNSPADREYQFRHDEERTKMIGETNAGRILVVVTTQRGEMIRVISAWDAESELRAFYLRGKLNEKARYT